MIALPLVLALFGAAAGASGAAGGPGWSIDFTAEQLAPWRPIHDGVMGGLSSGALRPGAEGTAVFAGELSLANNGGFASVRRPCDGRGLGEAAGLAVRVKGDGRTWQLRLRTDEGFDGMAYKAEFATTAGAWEEIRLPFTDFVPTFRGRVLSGVPPLDPERVRQVGFLLADKRAGSFRLEIAAITAYRDGEDGRD